jgi:hypothetical protein
VASNPGVQQRLRCPAKRFLDLETGCEVKLERPTKEEALLAYTRGDMESL